MFIACNTVMNPASVAAGIFVVDIFLSIFLKPVINGFILLIR